MGMSFSSAFAATTGTTCPAPRPPPRAPAPPPAACAGGACSPPPQPSDKTDAASNAIPAKRAQQFIFTNPQSTRLLMRLLNIPLRHHGCAREASTDFANLCHSLRRASKPFGFVVAASAGNPTCGLGTASSLLVLPHFPQRPISGRPSVLEVSQPA